MLCSGGGVWTMKLGAKARAYKRNLERYVGSNLGVDKKLSKGIKMVI